MNLRKLTSKTKQHHTNIQHEGHQGIEDPFLNFLFYRDLSKVETFTKENLRFSDFLYKVQEKLFNSSMIEWLAEIIMQADPNKDNFWINPYLLLLHIGLHFLEN